MAGQPHRFIERRDQVGLPVLDALTDMPTQSVARRLHDHHPDLWPSLDIARDWVRWRRGAKGTSVRQYATHPRELQAAGWITRVPESLESLDDTAPHDIKGTRVLVIGDVHIPYHNVEALSVTLDWASANDIDAVVLNGDIIDHYALSRFITDPTKRDAAGELVKTRSLIEEMRKEWPDAEIVYQAGNHEERWEAYLYTAGSRLAGIEAFRFEEVMRLGELNVRYLNRLKRVRIGKLNVVHGHEFGHSAYSPVNAARGLYLRAKAQALGGHFHQTSEHVERDLAGKFTATWSHGCLCELSPFYRPYNKWNHGFSCVEIVDEEGNFRVDNLRIIGGKVY